MYCCQIKKEGVFSGKDKRSSYKQNKIEDVSSEHLQSCFYFTQAMEYSLLAPGVQQALGEQKVGGVVNIHGAFRGHDIGVAAVTVQCSAFTR